MATPYDEMRKFVEQSIEMGHDPRFVRREHLDRVAREADEWRYLAKSTHELNGQLLAARDTAIAMCRAFRSCWSGTAETALFFVGSDQVHKACREFDKFLECEKRGEAMTIPDYDQGVNTHPRVPETTDATQKPSPSAELAALVNACREVYHCEMADETGHNSCGIEATTSDAYAANRKLREVMKKMFGGER